MIVCSCNVFSDADVRAAISAPSVPPRSAVEVYGCLGCSPKCGRCAATIKKIMDNALGCGGGCTCCPNGRHRG